MEVIWREIPKTNGRYIANTDGIIFDNKLNKNLPYSKHKRGWLRCKLWINGVRKTVPVHRAIMLTFVGESNLTVNHINGNKEDNSLENLEYVTASENNLHRSKVLNRGNRRKVRCLENGKIYPTINEASKDLGCDKSHIGSVCKGKYGFKSVKGYTFEYVSEISEDII